ncbi:major facilitator superfamily domain-containing protein 6 [Anopheles merus]|uniref:AGAP003204-PA n=3 Tax=gambiae species complex TaxID=44542 RepID=Q7QBE5_ANOGA|nr:major facilitator superfamily domain-containing protein 6 [Anopheles coluzzii]XP_041788255.1 major facilitator superfamily domain-containing protein 6 [Anopheles merus]XP_312908.4 major facilitator superfamily domain-containing protein 6 [Anopheles gambiae]EAA08483.4 AGAP003204-PA [Anopheles gambiae str. PEST]
MQPFSNDYGGGYGGGNGYEEQQPQQEIPMRTQGVARPMVDPEAMGEVDPTLYPQAKESTHKIRGKSDILEMLFGSVDQELLPVKTFYFFFYSAFGSLFPLMGVYFKQMGMNPGQCGLLIGTRPFVEFLSAPFWGSYADRCKKGKMLLLASLAAWIIFTLPLGFIQPPATSCIERKNATDFELRTPQVPRILKRSIDESMLEELSFGKYATDSGSSFTRVERAARPVAAAGVSPLDVSYANNFNEKLHRDWVSPLFSSIVYRTADIQKAFFLLLLLVIIGEFFSAPAITLADSAVITILGEDADRYGHQRMFGSLGWGLAMFFVGIALDHSTAFPDHPCGPEKQEKNYTICFATFSVLMGAALISATQIQFKYDYSEPQEPVQVEKVPQELTHEEQMQAQLAQQLQLPSLAATGTGMASAAPPPAALGAQTKMFAQTTREMPEWVTVLKQFKNLKCASFLFVAWFMGFGIGLIFTFLFWHLQDYGGSPTLFGVASVINHISEIFAYFFSFRLITQIGHVKVLCLGLVGNILRFLYISYLKNPWWVLPFEFMQGITHAAVWAACCSYIAHNTPQHLRSSAQGVLQGLHHGLGRGCGAVIGGMFVTYFGTTATFRGYGVICILVLAAFVFINFYRKDEGFISEIPTTEDPHQVAEETAHLAPHGVPSNPIPRALSSTRLNEIGQQNVDNGYGTYQTTGGALDVPGGAPKNPFGAPQGNVYGGNQY